MWMARGWSEEWYPAQEVNELIVKRGYRPVFILYWFADDISIQYIHDHWDEYFEYLKRVRKYLDTIKGKKVIVLNPEYNEQDVSGWDGYNDLLLKSKEVLDHGDISIGPCVGDFGDYSRSEDIENWKSFDPSLQRAISSFDFIAFQEMRSLTKNSRAEIEHLPQRIEAFSSYLDKTYHKPVFLAYLALSTWGEDGEALQEDVMKSIVNRQKVLQNNGLKAINIFHLADVPTHVGFFDEGEKYFGFLHSDLQKKESFKYLQKLDLSTKKSNIF